MRHSQYKDLEETFFISEDQRIATQYNEFSKQHIQDLLKKVDETKGCGMPEQDKRQLASNIHFLIVKDFKGRTPRPENVDVSVAQEQDGQFKTSVSIRSVAQTFIIEGEPQKVKQKVLKGLKTKVEEMVYGPKKDYLGYA